MACWNFLGVGREEKEGWKEGREGGRGREEAIAAVSREGLR